MPSRSYVLLIAGLGVLTACPGRLDDPDRFKACTLNVEQDIFVPKCGSAGCHAAASPQNGLDLVSAGVKGRLTGTSMCNGKPMSTFMIEKLGLAPACGSQMPLGEPLSPTETKCLKDYMASLNDGGI